MEASELDRDALLALLDRMLRAETVADAPPAAERGEWLYGSAGFTEPDEHGWMAPAPPADVWVPRALVFWRMAILSDAPVSDEQMRDPRHSLARWPAIGAAVKAMSPDRPAMMCQLTVDTRAGSGPSRSQTSAWNDTGDRPPVVQPAGPGPLL